MCANLAMIGYALLITKLSFSEGFHEIEIFLCCIQIILFQFGLGVNAHYVILELYAQGNILLTDSEFTVLTLLRSHRLVTVILVLLIIVYECV